MPDIWEIFSIEDTLIGDTEVWYVDQKLRAGNRVVRHALPKAVIAWRAAEYGLDHTTPESRQAILDLVLHEPHMAPIDAQQQHRNAKGVRRDGEEVHLYNAPDRATARTVHLAKLAATKQNIAQVVFPAKSGVDPMLAAMASHVPDQAMVNAFAAHVYLNRAKLGLDPMPISTPSEAKGQDPSVAARTKTLWDEAKANENSK